MRLKTQRQSYPLTGDKGGKTELLESSCQSILLTFNVSCRKYVWFAVRSSWTVHYCSTALVLTYRYRPVGCLMARCCRVVADEQERVQKKTFTNWMNSYLIKVSKQYGNSRGVVRHF